MSRETAPQSAVRRTVKNALWLLGGKGLGGVFSLIYLGLAARALGLQGFGEFALILSFGQAVASFAQFQSATVLIKFGAVHLHEDRHGRFTRLIAFTSLLDLLAALGCLTIAAAAVLLLGGPLGLTLEDQWRAAAFGISFLFSLRGTPLGLLRLFDRFDLSAATETVLPACRLLAAVFCFLLWPTIDGFLAGWIFAELVTSLVVWTAALRQLRLRRIPLQLAGWRSVRIVTRENPQIWKFTWFTNFAASVNVLWQQAVTLAVGWSVGPATAGGFRVAHQLAQALSKPVVSLARAVLPEFSRLTVSHGSQAVKSMAGKLSLIAGGCGAVAVLLAILAGEWLLVAIAGSEFAFAYQLLVLLAIAAAVDLWGFGQEPEMLAAGRAGTALAVRCVTGLLFTAILFVLLQQFGAMGAAAAAIAGNLLYRLAMTIMLYRIRG